MQELRQFKVYKISVPLYCGAHDGGQKNAHQPIFPYNVIKNSPTSLACNFVLIGPNNFKFGTKTRSMIFQGYQNLEQVDHNLHNQVSDDVICKPPIYCSLTRDVLSHT